MSGLHNLARAKDRSNCNCFLMQLAFPIYQRQMVTRASVFCKNSVRRISKSSKFITMEVLLFVTQRKIYTKIVCFCYIGAEMQWLARSTKKEPLELSNHSKNLSGSLRCFECRRRKESRSRRQMRCRRSQVGSGLMPSRRKSSTSEDKHSIIILNANRFFDIYTFKLIKENDINVNRLLPSVPPSMRPNPLLLDQMRWCCLLWWPIQAQCSKFAKESGCFMM